MSTVRGNPLGLPLVFMPIELPQAILRTVTTAEVLMYIAQRLQPRISARNISIAFSVLFDTPA